MRKLIVLLLILSFIPTVIAAQNLQYKHKAAMPQGTFKKKRDGSIVQYDKQGRKIGTYKFENGSYKKIK